MTKKSDFIMTIENGDDEAMDDVEEEQVNFFLVFFFFFFASLHSRSLFYVKGTCG
jgi:hypothetical protein